MGLALVGIILSLIKKAAGISLVDKLVSNWVKGTHNKIDDVVWKVIKFVATLDLSEDDMVVEMKNRLADVQTTYNLMDPDEKKLAKGTMVLADLGFFYNSEIGNA